jgi:hypothetical protein
MGKLLDEVHDALRVRQYSLATERNYLRWVQRFVLFHGKRHPNQMGKEEIEAFLTYLAVRRAVPPESRRIAADTRGIRPELQVSQAHLAAAHHHPHRQRLTEGVDELDATTQARFRHRHPDLS